MGTAILESDTGSSTLISKNITVMGRRTSVRLEPEMWSALKEIARLEGCRIHDICSLIELKKNPRTSLTAAIRVFLMMYYRAAATEEGHRRCGHGSFDNMVQRARLAADSGFSTKSASAIAPVNVPEAWNVRPLPENQAAR